MLAEKGNFLPIMDTNKILTRDAFVSKEDEKEVAYRQLSAKLYRMVQPIGPSLNGLYDHLLAYPDSLIYQDKKNRIQFALGDINDEELQFVSILPQKVDGRLRCKSVTFFQGNKKYREFLKQEFAYLETRYSGIFFKKPRLKIRNLGELAKEDSWDDFLPGIPPPRCIYFRGVQSSKIISFSLGLHGDIWGITERESSRDTRLFKLSLNDFDVLSLVGDEFDKKIEYEYHEDSFKLKDSEISIEDELIRILSKLPFEHEAY